MALGVIDYNEIGRSLIQRTWVEISTFDQMEPEARGRSLIQRTWVEIYKPSIVVYGMPRRSLIQRTWVEIDVYDFLSTL